MMNGPTRDGPSLDLDATRTASATTVADQSSGGRGVPASEERPTGDLLPTSGRLLWIPPDGQVREITRSSLRPGGETEGDVTRRCSACGAARSVETVVREHEICGYVGLGGFLRGEGRGHFGCPKCDGRPDDGRSDDWRPDDGRSDDGRPDDERSDDWRPDDGRATDGGGRGLERADEGRPDDGGDGRETGTDGGEVGGPASAIDVDEAFPPVSTVHSCLGCGRILDRPLGGDGSGD